MSNYNSGLYDFEQQVFCLSALSKVSFNLSGEASEIEKAIEEEVNNVLADQTVRGLLGNWSLTWGPSVYADSFIGKARAVNTIYVVAPEEHPEQAVVVIAGTNGTSLMNWIVEDFNVKEKVEWPYLNEEGNSSIPKISKGVSIGLEKLVSLTNLIQGSEQATTVREFLKAHPTITEVMVTGHSLGGALSPLLTLYLEDTRSEWDSSESVKLSCLATAGQTPGDKNFAQYYEGKLGAATKRIWNSMDIVPHVFDVKTLTAIPSLYEPQIQAPLGVVLLVEQLRRTLRDLDYVQILPDSPGFPMHYIKIEELSGKYKPLVEFIEKLVGSMKPPTPFFVPDYGPFGFAKFLLQAMIQHTVSYVMYFQVDEFASAMMNASKKVIAEPVSSVVPGAPDDGIEDVKESVNQFFAEAGTKFSAYRDQHGASYKEGVSFTKKPSKVKKVVEVVAEEKK